MEAPPVGSHGGHLRSGSLLVTGCVCHNGFGNQHRRIIRILGRDPSMLRSSYDPSRLKAVADLLRREYHAQQVILFGSVARGGDQPDSDVDLLVTAPTADRFY